MSDTKDRPYHIFYYKNTCVSVVFIHSLLVLLILLWPDLKITQNIRNLIPFWCKIKPPQQYSTKQKQKGFLMTHFTSNTYQMKWEILNLSNTKLTLEKEIKRIAPKVGLDPIRAHDLRHSHASLLVAMSFDILEKPECLKYESVKTTLDTYSHLYPDKDTKLVGELNRLRRPEQHLKKILEVFNKLWYRKDRKRRHR